MLGEFSISTEKVRISDGDNRSRKMWMLLAYLIYNRHRVIKQNDLLEILWSEGERDNNSSGALKTLFYRVRTELDRLWDGAGKDLILCQNVGYMWNPEYEVYLDCEKFDELNEKITEMDGDALEETVAFLNLYCGEFLGRFSSELWVIPVATYYHNTYIRQLLRVLPLLYEDGRYEEIIDFCRIASMIEPFHEEIHCYMIRAHIARGEHRQAVDIYQKLSDRLLSELGIMPSEETRSLYYEAIKSNNEHVLSVEALQEQLRETNSSSGALICDYDFFRVLYYSTARSLLRSGIAVYMALISVSGKGNGPMKEKKREKVLDNLKEAIRCSLRRSDSAARCSAYQYVIMLPRANYENSCMVCERILKAYYQKYSRLDAELRYEVFPIQPDDKVNYQWMLKDG